MSDFFGGGEPPDDEFYFPEEPPLHESVWGDRGVLVEDWWEENYTLYGGDVDSMTFTPYTLTAQEWYDATLMEPEQLREIYGITDLDIISIIHQLEDQNLWDSEDWEIWREMYEGG
jgi:hypothetical protein